MNAVDETTIREQLAHAVEILDPVAPPLAQLEARAAKRRRTFRITGGVGALALVGACVAVVAVVISAGPGGTAKVTPAAAPSSQSLVDFATANGAVNGYPKSLIIGGPYESSDGFYGGFVVKNGVDLASWDGSAWHVDGTTIKKAGPGRYLLKMTPGPVVGGPSVYVRGIGGSVSYFGFVLVRRDTGWVPARFGACGHHDLCYAGSTSQPYGRPGATGFVSVANSCTPDCASGTQYRVFWRWSTTAGKFVAVRTRKLS